MIVQTEQRRSSANLQHWGEDFSHQSFELRAALEKVKPTKVAAAEKLEVPHGLDPFEKGLVEGDPINPKPRP